MAKKLLQHLEAMTSHRDTALLDKGMVTSLRELLGVDEILLYDVARMGDELFVALTTWTDDEGVHDRHAMLTQKDYVAISRFPEMASCVAEAASPLFMIQGSPSATHFIPIHVGQQVIACCEIRHSKAPSRHQQYLANGVLALYRNYLSLLEDSQTDTLTGLANRKTFERSIVHLLVNDRQTPNSGRRSRSAAIKRARKTGWPSSMWITSSRSTTASAISMATRY